MQLPDQLIQSLQGVTGFNKETFVQIHNSSEQVTSIRLNPFKMNRESSIVNHELEHLFNDSRLTTHDSRLTIPVPWSSYGYYLDHRPSFTFDPLFHAGVYYVQEASSMFLEQALKQTLDLSSSLKVLDLCAAPGGKSTLIQSFLNNDSLLVSNEVIKSRAAILEENIIKWGAANVIVTNNDPKAFASLENYFDAIVIDAPCSGSGLFRRDADAINEWSENNVQLCSQRQQRIIADAWPALKKGGVLIYSTCSYSKEEDEVITDWIAEQFSVQNLRLNIDNNWGIVETVSEKHKMYGYRFYPDKLKGEGLFMAVLQKQDGEEDASFKPKKNHLEKPSAAETTIASHWIKNGNSFTLFKQNDIIIALPAVLKDDLILLQSFLYLRKAGIATGKIAGKDFIPDHALALSNIMHPNLVSVPLNNEQAIQYLRKEEVTLNAGHKGWAAVTYEGHCLGWVKILPNRVNNYYPKEWRILKLGK